MGIAYNPKIVTDGLVLALDAANPKSYPGSGATWSDLSGKGRNGSLVGTPTYAADNGGILTFNGTTQQVTIPNDIQLGAISFTSEMVVKIPTLEYVALLSWNGDGFNTDARGLSIRFRSPGYNVEYGFNDGTGIATRLQIPTVSLNTWTHLCFSHNFNGMVYGYVNGVLIGSIDLSSSGNASFTNLYDLLLARDANDYGNLTMPVFRLYTKALSEQEIKQNFNATRGRYGI